MKTHQPARRSANGSPAEVTASTTTEVDPVHFRRILGHYPTGVCVITTEHPEAGPVGTTVGSFTSVSLDPPLVAFFPKTGSRAYQRIAETGRFCVNVLSKDQADLCRRFASRESDKFDGVSRSPSPLGSPILDGVVAWIDCTLSHVQDAGDHLAVYGKVETLATGDHHAPLLFFQGGYGRFSSLSLTAPAEDDIAAQVRLADLARPRLEHISKEFTVEAHASTVSGDHVVQLAWAGAAGINLHAVSVPVFDSSGRVALVLTVQGLIRLSAADVDRCRAQLLDLADELTHRNQGVVPETEGVQVGVE